MVNDTIAQFTFLKGNTYYSVSSLVNDSTKLIFTRAGANDPDFNLRSESSYIIRKRDSNQIFINVIEIHGKLDQVAEFSSGSYPTVQKIMLNANNATYTIATVTIAGKDLLIV